MGNELCFLMDFVYVGPRRFAQAKRAIESTITGPRHADPKVGNRQKITKTLS